MYLITGNKSHFEIALGDRVLHKKYLPTGFEPAIYDQPFPVPTIVSCSLSLPFSLIYLSVSLLEYEQIRHNHRCRSLELYVCFVRW
jgi:hypothetical protein